MFKQMSAVETGQMSALDTGQMPSVARTDICLVSLHNVQVLYATTGGPGLWPGISQVLPDPVGRDSDRLGLSVRS